MVETDASSGIAVVVVPRPPHYHNVTVEGEVWKSGFAQFIDYKKEHTHRVIDNPKYKSVWLDGVIDTDEHTHPVGKYAD